ncbi:hypothetical protein [Mycobacterium aquaticum]|uniref:hypothetical protein n=1 Tax=Mycobacterium aquaticum TaxID=1927124 RepID=UPI0011525F33|nr:hypothetical protein [Mycobacterium aquaticum]
MTSGLHDRVARYLAATGWLAPEEVGELGGLWRHPSSHNLLPVPNQLVEDGIDWQVITERVAMHEGAKVADVAARLRGRAVDIANLRAAKDIVIDDTIPYLAGVALVESSWTMLRSSATTALGQRALIRKYSEAGDDLIKAARMAHTRKGSFIIPILLPITEAAPDKESNKEESFPSMSITAVPEPPERRVMRTFAEALATLDKTVVQPEREPRADVDVELVRAGVSHQFVSALHRVLEQDSVDEFSAAFEWSPLGGPAPKGLSGTSIPTTASKRIEAVAKRLKSRKAPRVEEQFVGPIRGVERDHDADTGRVSVEVAHRGRTTRVSVNVSPAVLDEAWQWARERKTVVVNSRVQSQRDGLHAVSLDAITPLMLDVKPS